MTFPQCRAELLDEAFAEKEYPFPPLELLSEGTFPGESQAGVSIYDVISSPEFQDSGNPLIYAIGRDDDGAVLLGDLKKDTHLLVAGTTGAGKSTFIHTLILSLLYKADPSEVRMLILDPTGCELMVYQGVPHLAVPIQSEPDKCLNVLTWVLCEINSRLKMFSETEVDGIDSYNELMEANGREKLRRLVVIADGLMSIVSSGRKKEAEEAISGITQFGRATGVHLVLSTPRPSSKMMSGIIKANIPSRISFSVTSALESRIVMDCSGAEELKEPGELLYLPFGNKYPIHGRAAYADAEVRRAVAEHLMTQFF